MDLIYYNKRALSVNNYILNYITQNSDDKLNKIFNPLTPT